VAHPSPSVVRIGLGVVSGPAALPAFAKGRKQFREAVVFSVRHTLRP
jgi:hypothetical protein